MDTTSDSLKLKPTRVELPDDLISIEPLSIKINPKIDAIIPGVNMFGDYDYWRIDSNLPIRKEEMDIVGNSVNGVADVKWVDCYTSIFGVKKNCYFKSEGDDGVVQQIVGTIHDIFGSKHCDDGTCNCKEDYENDFVELAMSVVSTIEQRLTKNSLLKTLVKKCSIKHARAV